ncbi:hypothetical protein HQ587_09210, partial [bacterium]|nr:hypothetical protein [bacterium]
GMGGAFIGVADDATSVVWNPAGLATLERLELSAVTRIVMDSYEDSFTDAAGNRYEKSGSLSHFVFNFVSIAFPLKIGEGKLVLAAAYQRQLDFYTSRSQPTEFNSEGGSDTFTPGLGFRLFPVMSIGAAANIWFGNANSEQEIIDASDRIRDQTFSGFNMVFGTLLDFGAMQSPFPLKLGASVKTPFELSEEKTAPGIDDPQTTIYEMPLMLGFGASLRIGENLTLAADYEMRMYGDSKKIPAVGNEEPLSPSEEDLNQIRVGMEYLLVLDWGVFPIRAGFQTVPTVFANYDKVNFKPKDQVSGIGFAFGTGYIAEWFAIDVTYSMQQYERENDANNLVGTFETVNNTVTMSGIIYF